MEQSTHVASGAVGGKIVRKSLACHHLFCHDNDIVRLCHHHRDEINENKVSGFSLKWLFAKNILLKMAF